MRNDVPVRNLILNLRGRRRIRPTLTTIMALGTACQRGEPARDTGAPPESTAGALLAYVTNEDSHQLSVIDTGSDSVIATISVGTRRPEAERSQEGLPKEALNRGWSP